MSRGAPSRVAPLLVLLLLGVSAAALGRPGPSGVTAADGPARWARHADGIFTSGYRHVLGQMSARRYMDGLVAARLGYALRTSGGAPPLAKRQADAIFTNGFSRYRHQQAGRNLLLSLLGGRRGHRQSVLLDSPPPLYSSSDSDQFQKLKEFIQITLQMSGV